MNSSQLIRTYYDALNQQNLPALMSLLDDRLVHEPNQAQRQEGKGQLAVFLNHQFEHYDEEVIDLAVMVNSDRRKCAAEYRVLGTYLLNDRYHPEAKMQHYDVYRGAFFEVVGGLITRITSYGNVADWTIQIERG